MENKRKTEERRLMYVCGALWMHYLWSNVYLDLHNLLQRPNSNEKEKLLTKYKFAAIGKHEYSDKQEYLEKFAEIADKINDLIGKQGLEIIINRDKAAGKILKHFESWCDEILSEKNNQRKKHCFDLAQTELSDLPDKVLKAYLRDMKILFNSCLI